MELLTFIYLFYIFIAFYFINLFIITFFQNRKAIFFVPTIKKIYSLTVLVPFFNEEASLRGTVEAILASDYGGLAKVILINDGSTDDSLAIARELEKKYGKVAVFDKKNSGKADSLNRTLAIVKTDLVAVIDADSYPDEHAISSMIGFFEDQKVGAVTTRILVKNANNFIQRLQSIEYQIIAFTRKLLGFLDAIYVTPGPLAIYRRSALVDINGFDIRNMTEDIEATWHLLTAGYTVRMSFVGRVFTVAPNTIKKWFKQRLRWNIGGMQTIVKYRKNFLKKGMLGLFILPFFAFSLVLGVIGLGILLYRIIRGFIVSYLSTVYSTASQTSILALQDINLNPSVLNFFGITLFILGIFFSFFALYLVRDKSEKRESFFSVIFYTLVYITAYPIILITSLYKFIRGKYTWR